MYISKTRIKLEKKYHDLKNQISIGEGTIIEPHAVIYPNVEIGNDCIIATSAVIKSHTKIGKHSIFGTLSNSEGSVEIGSWTTIQSQCHLGEGTRIGNNCFIGPLFMATQKKLENRCRAICDNIKKKRHPLYHSGMLSSRAGRRTSTRCGRRGKKNSHMIYVIFRNLSADGVTNHAGLNLSMYPHVSKTLFLFAISASFVPSETSYVMGFSTKTCFLASIIRDATST